MITHPLLSRLAGSGVRLGLERSREFLQLLGEPHRKYAVVHVAGTNGKGSTVAMVARSLEAAGYRVGAYHSPHTSHVNERIWIEGHPITDAALNRTLESLDRARRDWAVSAGFEDEPLTYFEMMTIAAFVAFANAAVDIVVLEVGLGGRLDATNVVSPSVVAVTSIGLDHQDVLGDDLVTIAGEKAGIFKKGVPAIVGPVGEGPLEVFKRRARVLNQELWVPGDHILRSQRKQRWSFSTPDGVLEDVDLAMKGAHQGANASVAVGILHQLRRQGFPVPDEAIRTGLETAWLPGRVEWVRENLLVDGAHNAEGTAALARYLSTIPRPDNRILLWGMGTGRDAMELVAPLLPYVDELVTTSCAHPKAREPYELAVSLQQAAVLLSAGGPIEESLPEVLAEADQVIVAGSLYLAGAARDLVASGAIDPE